MAYLQILPLLLSFIIPVIQAIPLTNSLTLHPTLPILPLHPNLDLSETRTHIHAVLTHPTLNNTPTARVALTTRPLTVHIATSTGRSLTRKIKLSKTYDHVAMEARDGIVNLHFRKRVPDIAEAVRRCGRIERTVCLKRLAARACLVSRRVEAMERLPCEDGCVEEILEDCQMEDIWVRVRAVLTRLAFGGIAGMIVFAYGWGFLSAIVSIPKETMRIVSWTSEILRQIRVEGVKNGFLEEVIRFV